MRGDVIIPLKGAKRRRWRIASRNHACEMREFTIPPQFASGGAAIAKWKSRLPGREDFFFRSPGYPRTNCSLVSLPIGLMVVSILAVSKRSVRVETSNCWVLHKMAVQVLRGVDVHLRRGENMYT
ncbi:uncharacterized protein LOC105699813 isoform X2 [Orussus abietinus]|uniref:uncharacterized protein LOC105699813 isoform X2 n=1 Tax=Orussus abietinus TaxID=222816 RepID=UPI000626BC3C|nr:uncharacterized protein LOC105699813 isoform X2 [Orussus abietinus]